MVDGSRKFSFSNSKASKPRFNFAVIAILCWAWLPSIVPIHPLHSSNDSERTNFVFFLVDDLGWMDIGANGSPFYETPNIDKLDLI